MERNLKHHYKLPSITKLYLHYYIHSHGFPWVFLMFSHVLPMFSWVSLPRRASVRVWPWQPWWIPSAWPPRVAPSRPGAMAAAWCFGATRGTSSGSSSNFGCWTFLDEDWDSTGGSTLIKKEWFGMLLWWTDYMGTIICNFFVWIHGLAMSNPDWDNSGWFHWVAPILSDCICY